MEVLEKAVAQRIEGTQVEERADNKMWLVRYLEVCYHYCNIFCPSTYMCVHARTHVCATSFTFWQLTELHLF